MMKIICLCALIAIAVALPAENVKPVADNEQDVEKGSDLEGAESGWGGYGSYGGYSPSYYSGHSYGGYGSSYGGHYGGYSGWSPKYYSGYSSPRYYTRSYPAYRRSYSSGWW